MGCMVQVLGQPDDELLDRALYGHRFFKVVSRQQGLTWELMVSPILPSCWLIFFVFVNLTPL